MFFRYIDTILNDDHLNQSEIVYAFLNPRPEYYSRSKSIANSKGQEPFSKISQALSSVSQKTAVEENRTRSIGLRDIYLKRKTSEAKTKADEGIRANDRKLAFTSSITNFFNDSNPMNSTSLSGEKMQTLKTDQAPFIVYVFFVSKCCR